jgi:hypothetical protein
MKALPDFIVETYGHTSNPAVSWTQGDRRYHFWLDRDGVPHGAMHSNPVVRNPNARRDEHRALNLRAKKWAPLIAAIMAKVRAENLVAKAHAAEAAQVALADQKRAAENATRMLTLFDRAASTVPDKAREALAYLSDTQKIAFVTEIERIQ